MIYSKQTTTCALRSSLIVASSLLILQACATPEQRANQDAMRLEDQRIYKATIPRCTSDKECAAKWSAARRWVLDNCGFRLQHITDDYMETFNIRDVASTSMWCRVTKSPISETESRIELENGVNNPFAQGVLDGKRREFNSAVNAAWSTTE